MRDRGADPSNSGAGEAAAVALRDLRSATPGGSRSEATGESPTGGTRSGPARPAAPASQARRPPERAREIRGHRGTASVQIGVSGRAWIPRQDEAAGIAEDRQPDHRHRAAFDVCHPPPGPAAPIPAGEGRPRWPPLSRRFTGASTANAPPCRDHARIASRRGVDRPAGFGRRHGPGADVGGGRPADLAGEARARQGRLRWPLLIACRASPSRPRSRSR